MMTRPLGLSLHFQYPPPKLGGIRPQPPKPRFGICPVCTTLGMAGLVLGAAGVRLVKQRLTPIVGEKLAEEVERKLVALNQQKAGFLDRFKGLRAIDDKELMAALGEDLVKKLQGPIQRYFEQAKKK